MVSHISIATVSSYKTLCIYKPSYENKIEEIQSFVRLKAWFAVFPWEMQRENFTPKENVTNQNRAEKQMELGAKLGGKYKGFGIIFFVIVVKFHNVQKCIDTSGWLSCFYFLHSCGNFSEYFVYLSVSFPLDDITGLLMSNYHFFPQA